MEKKDVDDLISSMNELTQALDDVSGLLQAYFKDDSKSILYHISGGMNDIRIQLENINENLSKK